MQRPAAGSPLLLCLIGFALAAMLTMTRQAEAGDAAASSGSMTSMIGRLAERGLLSGAGKGVVLPSVPSPPAGVEVREPRAEGDWSLHGSYDLIVVVPEKICMSEYLSPGKYPNLPGREYPSGTFSLIVDGHPVGWLRFHSLSLFDTDGTALNTHGGVYNYRDVFQHRLYGAKFEEAYGEAEWNAFALRVGLQKFAWGKLDALAPNDVINPLEAYNPFLSGLAGIRDSEIGVPAAQVSYYLTNEERPLLPEETSLQAVWEPFYVPPRYDNTGERWFPPTLTAPQNLTFKGTPIVLSTAFNNAPPPARLDRPTLGFRIGNTWSSLDLDAYYYYGYQTGFRADGDVQAFLASAIPPVLGARVGVFPLFKRFQSLGMAGASQFGSFGVRAEFALQKNALFGRDLTNAFTTPSRLNEIEVLLPSLLSKTAPLSLAADAVRSGASADYASHGYIFLLQANETDINGSARDLLNPKHETQLIGSIRKSFLSNRLQFALSSLYSIQAADSFLEPTFAYQFNDSFSLTIGYLKIAGPRKTVLGQFHDNDEVFARARYVF